MDNEEHELRKRLAEIEDARIRKGRIAKSQEFLARALTIEQAITILSALPPESHLYIRSKYAAHAVTGFDLCDVELLGGGQLVDIEHDRDFGEDDLWFNYGE